MAAAFRPPLPSGRKPNSDRGSEQRGRQANPLDPHRVPNQQEVVVRFATPFGTTIRHASRTSSRISFLSSAANNAAASGRLELAQLCGGRSFDATEGVGRLVRA